MYKSIIPMVLFASMIMIGCNQPQFKKLENGLEYKVISGKGGDQVKPGNFLMLVVSQYYNDSLLTQPSDTVPQIVPVDSALGIPGPYVRIFLAAKNGDSVVTRLSTDTLKKHGPLPPFAKEHQYFVTAFRILKVFPGQAEAVKAETELRERAMKADSIVMVKQKAIDEKTIQDYLQKNNIKAEKTPGGTYVEIINPGTGPKVDSGMAASVLYKGSLFNGQIFEQSYDSTGKPLQPYTFVIGEHGAIPGWEDGLVLFHEGGEGRLFIPSGRAYGTVGNQRIPANSPLVFDIKVTKVMSRNDYMNMINGKKK